MLIPVIALAGTFVASSALAQDDSRAEPDYKIAFWFSTRDVNRTFKYQIYDLKKGEFPIKAVDEWLSKTNVAGSKTKAYLKDVSLWRGTDRSDTEQLQAVIDAERIAINDGFLGLADDAIRKIGDEAPQSALRDITKITKVTTTTHDEYLRQKQNGKINAQEVRDGFVYYATDYVQHVPFRNGVGAYVTITERYKAKLPDTQK